MLVAQPARCGLVSAGWFSASKQGELKEFEEAVHIFEADGAQPFALKANRREDILLLVSAIVVELCSFRPRRGWICPLVKLMQVINKEIVKQVFTAF